MTYLLDIETTLFLEDTEVKIDDFHNHEAAKEFIAEILAGDSLTLEKME